jgi:uracil-DNA glycosylase
MTIDGNEAAGLALREHRERLLTCRDCPDMIGPVVAGPPIASRVFLLGQAPGPHEGKFGKPFAWTAGKTLFRWFAQIGVEENVFRRGVYMAAVCRCFPGKSGGGGDRVPSKVEIETCSSWLRAEIGILRPRLLVPVGKLAISQVLEARKLVDVVGRLHSADLFGFQMDVVPLPHPSGASTWHRTEPGVSLLNEALELLAGHPEMASLRSADTEVGRF